jgi:Tol biopolymer transport system component
MRNIFICLSLLWGNLFAYSFGKNKFQTRAYDFRIYETQNFRIFSYSKDDFMVKFAGTVLEKAYNEYVSTLGISIESKIPVIIYNSPKHFSETNVIPDVIEEGIGGFTEIFKTRVVVPFNGSYADFKHVLRHELVHVFQYAMMRKGKRSTLEGVLTSQVPLWATEGMAEFLSIGWSPDAERYVRDLILSDKLPTLVELNYYGGYIVYKLGQLFYKYLQDTYGKEKIAEFYSLLVYTNSVDRAFKKSFGISQKEFDLRFKDYIRRNFYPIFGVTTTPINLKRYSDHEKMGNFYNVAPLLSPDGGALYFIQERMGDFYIVKYSVATAERLGVVFKSSKIPDFENIHILRPSLSISGDGRYIVFSAQSGEGDQIYLFDTRRNRVIKRIGFDVDAIYTPAISSDGRRIVFVGLKEGHSDIYLYEWRNNEMFKLTDDPWDDRDPVFDDKGNIVFVSDRVPDDTTDAIKYGAYAVFKLNLDSKEIVRVTDYYSELSQPQPQGDTLLYFIARDRYSALNLFVEDLKNGSVYRITDFPTELKWYTVSKTGKVIASILFGNGYDIYEVRNLLKIEDSTSYAFDSFEDTLKVTLKKYAPKFSLDWIYGSASYATISGFEGTVAFGVSDELGDHQIQFTTDLSGDILNSNFELDYFNLKGRTDRGFSFYQLWDAGYISYDTVLVSRTLGIMLMQIHPLSRNRRFELGLSIENETNYYFWETPLGNFIELTDLQKNRLLTGLYGAHVFDNVYYNYIQDPIKGVRYYVGLFRTIPFDVDLGIFVADFRHYLAFSEDYLIASRLKFMNSFGRDRYYFTFDGITDLRGVEFADYIGNKYLVFNTEFRFPFVKRLSLGFPLPIDISGIGGVLFFDAGLCTYKDYSEIQPFDPFPKLKDLKADFGYGLRMWLGFAKLKVDFAYNTDFETLYKPVKINISLGFDY